MKPLKFLDILIVCAFVFMILTRFITVGYMEITSEVTGTQIENVVKVFEANPLAKLLLGLKGVYAIISYLVFPAAVVAVYMVLRSKHLKGKVDFHSLSFYAYIMFLTFLLNVLNDAAMVIGKYISML